MGVVKQCHRCQRRVLTEKRGEGEGEGERRGSERDRMLRELLTPRPTDWYCFLQYRMTNVARPSVRASPSRSHDYRSRRGHSERSRISTRLSSCNSQEFIIEKGKRSVRWFVRSQYRVSVRRISYKSGRRRGGVAILSWVRD